MRIFLLLVSMLQVSSMWRVACGRKSSSEFGGPLCPTGVLSWSADGRVLVHHSESWCGLLKWGRNIDMKIEDSPPPVFIHLSVRSHSDSCWGSVSAYSTVTVPKTWTLPFVIELSPCGMKARKLTLSDRCLKLFAETLQLHATSSQWNLSPALPAGHNLIICSNTCTIESSMLDLVVQGEIIQEPGCTQDQCPYRFQVHFTSIF